MGDLTHINEEAINHCLTQQQTGGLSINVMSSCVLFVKLNTFSDVLLHYWLVNMEEFLRLRDSAAIIINLHEILICRLTDG